MSGSVDFDHLSFTYYALRICSDQHSSTGIFWKDVLTTWYISPGLKYDDFWHDVISVKWSKLICPTCGWLFRFVLLG